MYGIDGGCSLIFHIIHELFTLGNSESIFLKSPSVSSYLSDVFACIIFDIY